MTKNKFVKVRSFLFTNVENILENLVARRQDKQNSSDDLFGASDTTSTGQINWKTNFEIKSILQVLSEERTSLGLYVSGNPLQDYKELEEKIKNITNTDNLHLVVVEKVKKIFTRNNAMMLALQITSTKQSLEGIIFPSHALKYSPVIQESKMFWVYGKISIRKRKEVQEEEREYDELPKLIVDAISPFEDGVASIFNEHTEEISNQRKEMIGRIDWLKLADQPDYDFIKDLDNPKLTSQQADKKPTQQPQFFVVKLAKTLGPSNLKKIKQELKKEKTPDAIEVKVEVQSKGGWKMAKGSFWLERPIFESLKEQGVIEKQYM